MHILVHVVGVEPSVYPVGKERDEAVLNNHPEKDILKFQIIRFVVPMMPGVGFQ
jgi:hypothetical protein